MKNYEVLAWWSGSCMVLAILALFCFCIFAIAELEYIAIPLKGVINE